MFVVLNRRQSNDLDFFLVSNWLADGSFKFGEGDDGSLSILSFVSPCLWFLLMLRRGGGGGRRVRVRGRGRTASPARGTRGGAVVGRRRETRRRRAGGDTGAGRPRGSSRVRVVSPPRG